MNKEVLLIVAYSNNRAIGKNGAIPWHLPEDLRRFKELTTGHSVIMGRKTWDSLPTKPLPGRENIVLTRTLPSIPGALICRTLEDAISKAAGPKVFIIGGKEVYKEALSKNLPDHILITKVQVEVEGADTFFPYFSDDHYMPTDVTNIQTSSTGLSYRYITYTKVGTDKIALGNEGIS